MAKQQGTRVQLIERREKVRQLSLMGIGTTKIAEQLGISVRLVARDYEYIEKKRLKIAADPKLVEKHRMHELEYLLGLRRRVEKIGQDPTQQITYVDKALQVHDRIAKLLGLEAPKEVRHADADGQPIHSVTQIIQNIFTDEPLDMRIVEHEDSLQSAPEVRTGLPSP